MSRIDPDDARLLEVLDGLPIAVMLRAPDGTLLHHNPGAERFVERLGVGVDAIAPGPRALLAHVEVIDEDGRPYDPDTLPVVSSIRDERKRDATVGFRLPDGGHAWYSVRAVPVPLSDGTSGTVVTLDDVTERHEARRQLAITERSLRLTFDHAPIGIAVVAPDGRLLRVNPALCDLLGQDEADLLAAGLHPVLDPDDGEDAVETDAADASHPLDDWLAATDDRHLLERRLRHASGRWLYALLSVALVRDDEGHPIHLIVQVVDLTDRRALEEELRTAAVEDPLTGLANRRALADHLAEAQQRQAREGGAVGLLYVDLDRFKAINDTHGHDVGDRVLIEAGWRLLAETREVDTVCRLGGDEFAVLCAQIDGAAGLQDLVDRLVAMPPVSVEVDGRAVEVGGSIGAVLVQPTESLDEALRRADSAMYRAKRTTVGDPPQGLHAAAT